MILRLALLVLVFVCSLTSTLFAGGERGNHLIAENGGIPGAAGIGGLPGAAGLPGVPGIPGVTAVLDLSDFYALMPGDNAAPVGANVAVQFPQNGPSTGIITRLGPSTFLLPSIGTYLVLFQVSVTEAGQLMLRLNGGLVANSVVGRATGTDQIIGMSLVTTSAPGSVLDVINPPGNSPALTITPNAGGTHAVSAHLSIIRIQ